LLKSAWTTFLLLKLPAIARIISTHATIPSFFGVFLIEMGSHQCFCWDWAWTTILLFSASLEARITSVSHCVQLLVTVKVSQTFCPGCLFTVILLISASPVARILDHLSPGFVISSSFVSTLLQQKLASGEHAPPCLVSYQ
jgi:hypothetical protein